MIKIEIPGWKKLELKYLVCDYNGTLACDGKLMPHLAELLNSISKHLDITVITADTFGFAKNELADLPVTIKILKKKNQTEQKAKFVQKLGAENCVCIGNGRNDRLMLKEAALAICTVQAEGVAVESLKAADIVCSSALDAMQLLLHPRRLIATLRS